MFTSRSYMMVSPGLPLESLVNKSAAAFRGELQVRLFLRAFRSAGVCWRRPTLSAHRVSCLLQLAACGFAAANQKTNFNYSRRGQPALVGFFCAFLQRKEGHHVLDTPGFSSTPQGFTSGIGNIQGAPQSFEPEGKHASNSTQ